MHAAMPRVRGGRGGCEAEAHPVSGKLSHLFPRPVWATPQPGAVSQCPQKAHWHFWDVSRGFSGHLLFNIWVATWELESCWVCWVWGFFKRNQNLKLFPGGGKASAAGRLHQAGQGVGGSVAAPGRAGAGQKMGVSVHIPLQSTRRDPLPQGGCAAEAVASPGGPQNTVLCHGEPSSARLHPDLCFSPQSLTPQRCWKRVPHGCSRRRGAGTDPAPAGRCCPGPARCPGLPGRPVRCLQTVRAAHRPSALPPGAGNGAGVPSVAFGG